MTNKKYEVIIIGGGVAGLSCGALLAKQGLNVLILDKNEQTGGRCMPFSTKKGYKHELGAIGVCPAVNHNLDIVYRKLGIGPNANIVPPEITSVRYLTKSGNWNKQDVSKDEQIGDNPDPARNLQLFGVDKKEEARAIEVMADIFFYSKEKIDALDKEDITCKEFLSRYGEIPSPVYNFLAMMANGMQVLPYDYMSAAAWLASFQEIMYCGGGGYIKGSVGGMVNDLENAFRANGGDLKTGTKVNKITVDDGRVVGVVTEKGDEFKCPIVISNIGVQPTVLNLVGEEHFDKTYINYVKELVQTWGWSSAWYYLSKPVLKSSQITILSETSYWDTERFKKIAAGEVPDEVWVYGIVPTNYDPSLAPPGKQLLNVGTNCLPDETDKDMLKKLFEIADRTILEHFPEIEPVIEDIIYYGPSDVCDVARAPVIPAQNGGWGGVANMVGQSGRKRPPIKQPLQGLFCIGLDTSGEGVGLQGSTYSAMRAAEIVPAYLTMRPKVLW